MSIPRVLIVAGSDSGGGAGLQADIKSCDANGVFSMTAVTAVTAQNTKGVHGVVGLEPTFVVQQMDVVLTDIGVDAVKTGMLATVAVVEAVAERLEQVKPIVVDPVMVTANGDRLIDVDAVEAVQRKLLPLATIATPNRREAALLLDSGAELNTVDELKAAAKAIKEKFGPQTVLVKGGHAGREDRQNDWITIDDDDDDDKGDDLVVDVLYDGTTAHVIACPRIETRNTHGTGCTLASAIAAHLARGLSVRDAVIQARRYLSLVLQRSQSVHLGQGSCGPLIHFDLLH